jgi:hypothetical protein
MQFEINYKAWISINKYLMMKLKKKKKKNPKSTGLTHDWVINCDNHIKNKKIYKSQFSVEPFMKD